MLAGEQTKLNLKVRLNLPSINAVSVQVPTAKAVAVAAQLRQQPGVKSVDISTPRQYFDTTPNDSWYGTYQAAYLGSYNSSTGVGGVEANKAWDVETGTGATVAILDSGFDLANPDLSGKFADTYNAYYGAEGFDVSDTVGHGTIVAGVAAAVTNNGSGVSGAGYNTHILGVKIADPNGDINTDTEIAGLNWAVENGAKVISLSFGSSQQDSTERAAVEAAVSSGALVIASAGNEGDIGNPIEYPAGYPGVIAVGATDAKGHRASFSEYGSWVTVAAPGTGIASTASPGSEITPGASNYVNGEAGTSFSAPIVAAEAALLWNHAPSLTAAQVKAALVNSAHGYSGQSLGHGQVDFNSALAHLAPTSTPTVTAPAANAVVSDTVTLTATSTAPAVLFTIGSVKVGPVHVLGGVATATWASNGYNNSSAYNVTATDCTLTGECASTASTPVPFTVTNTAPIVTSPEAAQSVNGTLHFAATSSAGGVEFYVDGTPAAFAPIAPYTAVAAPPVVNGTHSISARQCNATGSVCGGPASTGFDINTNAFALPASPLSPNRFSPNGDKVEDATLSTLTIPSGPSEPTYLTVYDSTGKTVYNTTSFGSYAPGNHTVSWSGKSNNGSTITDGTYSVVFESTKGSGLWSSVVQKATVDLIKPTLTGTNGSGRTFYPIKDNYGDTFVPTTTLSETSTLSLVITTSTGSPVRTISATRSAGVTSLSWTGYNAAGHLAAAGTYHWHWVARDAAGNSTTSPTYTVTLSWRKLVSKTANVVVYANKATHKIEFGDDSHQCVFYADGPDQHYAQGLELYDLCADDGPPYEGGGATYKIAVPAATIYNSVGLTITGFTGSGQGMLFGGFNLVSSVTDAPSPEQTYPNKGLFVTKTSTATYGLGSVLGAYHVTKSHYVYLEWDVTNQNSSSAADFDAAYVTVVVHYQLLQ